MAAVRCQLGLQSSLSLIAAGGFVSRAAHSHGWQTGAGCVNLHSIVLNVFIVQYVSLSVLTVWWLASFRGSNPNGTKAEASLPFTTFQYSRLGLYSVVFYWSHRPDLIHCGRELCKAMNTRR